MIENIALGIMCALVLLGLSGLALSIFRGSPADRANKISARKRLRSASTKLRRRS